MFLFFSSFNLERSQSLRISKKSLRSLSSKGGSLRLSKKEAATALKQVKEAEESESNCNGELTESTLATPHQTVRFYKCLLQDERLYLKVVLRSWYVDILIIRTNFQESSLDCPQQLPTEK